MAGERIAELSIGDKIRCSEGVFTITAIKPIPLDEVPDPWADQWCELPCWDIHPLALGAVDRFVSVRPIHAHEITAERHVPEGGTYIGQVTGHPLWRVEDIGFTLETGDATDGGASVLVEGAGNDQVPASAAGEGIQAEPLQTAPVRGGQPAIGPDVAGRAGDTFPPDSR